MNVFEAVEDALDTLSTPYGCGEYLVASGDLPDVFMFYTVITAAPAQHADNTEKEAVERVQVSIYSRNGLADLPDVDGAMKAAGLTPGPYRQLPYEPDTRHFGLAKDFFRNAHNGDHP